MTRFITMIILASHYSTYTQAQHIYCPYFFGNVHQTFWMFLTPTLTYLNQLDFDFNMCGFTNLMSVFPRFLICIAEYMAGLAYYQSITYVDKDGYEFHKFKDTKFYKCDKIWLEKGKVKTKGCIL